MDDFIVGEIISNIYGIDFIDKNEVFSSRKMNRQLHYMGINLNKVIFSTCHNKETKSTWIVAAHKYYDEKEVEILIRFMIDNNMYAEYYIGEY